MKARLQFVIMMCAVATITAIVSYSFASWFRIETRSGGYLNVGRETARQSVFLAGSSVAGDGLAWGRIGDALNLRFEVWAVPNSSPSEWEQFQGRATQTKLTILVVSAFDLNEYFPCDFRAELVPLGQTIKDLLDSGADWPYGKRLLSQYPLRYLRVLYPTAGRSERIMVGIRGKLNELGLPVESEAGPTLTFNETGSSQKTKKETIIDWPIGKTLRRLAFLRSISQGKHGFNGPKKLALLRMLRQAQERGHTVVVVLPVSSIYGKEFLTSEVNREFEAALTEAQHSVPKASWVRLDQVNGLTSNEYFWDFVHMNSYGQTIATEAFLRQFKEFTSLQ